MRVTHNLKTQAAELEFDSKVKNFTCCSHAWTPRPCCILRTQFCNIIDTTFPFMVKCLPYASFEWLRPKVKGLQKEEGLTPRGIQVNFRIEHPSAEVNWQSYTPWYVEEKTWRPASRLRVFFNSRNASEEGRKPATLWNSSGTIRIKLQGRARWVQRWVGSWCWVGGEEWMLMGKGGQEKPSWWVNSWNRAASRRGESRVNTSRWKKRWIFNL